MSPKHLVAIRNRMKRRDFLVATVGSMGVGLATASIGVSPSAFELRNETKRSTRILTARLGHAVRLPNCSGDTWTATWADDDNLYSTSDDTSGFNKACNSNLAVNQISGDTPPELRGLTINCMAEFGTGSATLAEDGGMWKACGLTCVDGILYMSVSRQLTCPTEPYGVWQGRSSPFWIQETWDASIIKSTDHGKTWSTRPRLNHAMFPGRIFSTPFFVQYGKDGQGTVDGAAEFVYAVSNDGAWNNGNWMTMGRVRRDRIGRLDPGDWEFIHGYDAKGNPIWRARCDDALYIFRAPGRTSMTGIHYIRGLGLYIMPQWHYPYLEDEERRWKATRWEFYQAPAPWGPWTLFFSQEFEPQSWYNPCIPSKFISEDGKTLWIFTAGDFLGDGRYYGLNLIPMTLDVKV
jgi:hypothetical protein